MTCDIIVNVDNCNIVLKFSKRKKFVANILLVVNKTTYRPLVNISFLSMHAGAEVKVE